MALASLILRGNPNSRQLYQLVAPTSGYARICLVAASIHNHPWIVICDFDGTITTQDLGGALIRTYGDPPLAKTLYHLFLTGEITLAELQFLSWRALRVTPHEVRAFMEKTAVLRKGFHQFLNFCASNDIQVQIVSGGFDFYIPNVMKRFHLNIKTSINQGTIGKEGVCVNFPFFHRSCGFCSNCKAGFIRQLRKRNQKDLFVIGIGDGDSDRCLTKEADLIFACSSFLEYCRERHIPCHAFEDFATVIEILKQRRKKLF